MLLCQGLPLSVSYYYTHHLKIRKTVSLQDCYYDNKISGGFRLWTLLQVMSAISLKRTKKVGGRKSEYRMSVGCRFITCAVKRKKIESCGECPKLNECEKWRKHRDYSLYHDTVICHQKLEVSISLIQNGGIEAFNDNQKRREALLRQMLEEFNEGRSKNYFCIAATVLEIDEIEGALHRARELSDGLNYLINQKFCTKF